jgi:hypothetical protein
MPRPDSGVVANVRGAVLIGQPYNQPHWASPKRITRLPVTPGRYPRGDERENSDGCVKGIRRHTSVELHSDIALLAFVERAESPNKKVLVDADEDEPPRRNEVRRLFGWCWRFFPRWSAARHSTVIPVHTGFPSDP